MARRLTGYRLGKEVYRTLKHGPSVGRAQYIGRRVWYASKTQPGGNYSNPKARRK